MMEHELIQLIRLFNIAQQQAVEVLESEFGCRRPESQSDFIVRCVPAIREANYSAPGYKIRPHGIGMEVTGKGLSIDFDFGEKGQFNGFDAYRLHNFAYRNKLKIAVIKEAEIEASLRKSIENGVVVKGNGMGSVHYLQSR